ncbi:MAG: SPOR domain-containing protein [bacterium]
MRSHSCISYLLGIAAALFSSPEIVNSQISESEILSLLWENQIAVAQERVRSAYQKNPNSPLAAYYHGLFEENAEAASSSFLDVTKRFKNSEYAERALYRLGQYHFARGSYMRARQFLQELAASYPGSACAGPAQYFAAKALMISGQPAQAQKELQAVAHDHASTWMGEFAREDLARLPEIIPPAEAEPQAQSDKKSAETAKAGTAQNRESRYAVQVGAFTDKQKAQSVEKRFKGSGYKSEVHERKEGARSYFLVWVGAFLHRDEARKCADDLKQRYNVKSHVVRRDD